MTPVTNPQKAHLLSAVAPAEHYGFGATYTDYHTMLAEVQPDIVSISTWPHLHAPMVVDTAKCASVRAIHCEKPMAPTWGEAKRMVAVCKENSVQLTFNHQRRFLEPFHRAKELAHDGAIGELVRIEGSCPDLIDWGTHWFDMFFFYNNETPAKWVLGQIDSREERPIFGLMTTNQGLSEFMFENGVRAMLLTGHDHDIGAANRLIGTKGFIEVRDAAPHVRVRGEGMGGFKDIETSQGLHDEKALSDAMVDVVEALAAGRLAELDSSRAIQATEVIFATYESSRRRGRVDLPLEPEDSAFLSMIEAGDLNPKPRQK